MANQAEMSARLLKRFKGVPNVALTDTNDWIEDALLTHGYTVDAVVTPAQANVLVLYAAYQGALSIALSTAHYFKYTDAEEQVDKAAVSEQYRKLSEDLRKQYDAKKAEGVDGIGGSRFVIMKRADRL